MNTNKQVQSLAAEIHAVISTIPYIEKMQTKEKYIRIILNSRATTAETMIARRDEMRGILSNIRDANGQRVIRKLYFNFSGRYFCIYPQKRPRSQKQRAASRINGRKGGRPGKFNIGLECLAIAICKGVDLTLDLQSIGRVPENLLYKLRAELIAAAIQ